MKKSILAALLCASATSVALAQNDALYQIPNGKFENWTTDCGSTYQANCNHGNGDMTGVGSTSPLGDTKRPGTEPVSWSASNFSASMWKYPGSIGGKEIKISAGNLVANGGEEAVLTNALIEGSGYYGVIGFGTVKYSANIPGFMSLAKPYVRCKAGDNNWYGGVYGGILFAGRPDAIKGKYKRTGDNEENAHIIAYVWKETFKSNIKVAGVGGWTDKSFDDVDATVLSGNGDGTLVASCDYAFATTANNDWEEITVPLEYKNEETPEKMNVIISSGDYWNNKNIKAGNKLEMEYVEYVYYPASVSNVQYNGQDVTFDEDKNAVMDENVAYDTMDGLTYSKGGNGQIVTKSFDPTTGILTIVVTGGDYGLNGTNQATYTIKFAKEKVSASMVAKAETKYGTFYAPFAVAVPEGMKAYTCSVIEGSELQLEEVTGEIPALTPVIVETTSDDKSENPSGVIAVENYGKEVVSGLLCGVLERKVAPDGSYILQNHDGKVKFYLVNHDVAQPYVPANRCYLSASNAAGVKSIAFPGNATAIEAVDALLNGEAGIYDLNGRKLDAMRKGINIVNGKKVLVK